MLPRAHDVELRRAGQAQARGVRWINRLGHKRGCGGAPPAHRKDLDAEMEQRATTRGEVHGDLRTNIVGSQEKAAKREARALPGAWCKGRPAHRALSIWYCVTVFAATLCSRKSNNRCPTVP